tara:strand:+ start:2239 stop:4254 length:2016 start_codon:yes stop_codon:yes gene_type:complete
MRKGRNTAGNYGTRSISIVQQARATETKDFDLEKVIEWIRSGSGRFAKNISAVREATEAGDLDRASELKKNLPAVMFSGQFSRRSSKCITSHSGMICMDVDKIDAPSKKVDEMRFDPHIVAAFVSPSGNGLKAIFAIPSDVDKHRDAFEAAKRYLSTYGLEADESGKDVSRLCFLSHDAELHYAPDAVELPVHIEEQSIKQAETADIERNSTGDRIGDRYAAAPNVRERSVAILQSLGWQIQRGDSSRTYCTRPGKQGGISGEIRSDGSFFCYTDGAAPLEPLQNYSPFALYTTTEHGGDFKAAALALAEEFGDNEPSVDGREFYNKNEAVVAKEVEVEVRKAEAIGSMPTWTSANEIPEDLNKLIMQRYPVLIDGLLHRGTKMVLGGGSKSYKTWTLLNLAASVASGTDWFGHKVINTGLDVIFLNFEVPHEFFLDRVRSVCKAMDIDPPANLKVWSLRGVCNDLNLILETLQERLSNGCALLCIDPIYKAIGDRDENSAGDMGLLMNEIEAIVEKTGAAVAFGAHYSKGNQADKDPLDRISGSGVFARDPDTIMGLTAHEEENCYTVHSALRNFAGKEPFVVEWEFPLFSPRQDLDAHKLKRAGQKISAGKILSEIALTGEDPKDFVPRMATKHDVSDRTVYRLLKSLSDAKKIHKTAGSYFPTTNPTL